MYWVADDGIGRGYLEGCGGGWLRSTALLFVNAWVMMGSVAGIWKVVEEVGYVQQRCCS